MKYKTAEYMNDELQKINTGVKLNSNRNFCNCSDEMNSIRQSKKINFEENPPSEKARGLAKFMRKALLSKKISIEDSNLKIHNLFRLVLY